MYSDGFLLPKLIIFPRLFGLLKTMKLNEIIALCIEDLSRLILMMVIVIVIVNSGQKERLFLF